MNITSTSVMPPHASHPKPAKLLPGPTRNSKGPLQSLSNSENLDRFESRQPPSPAADESELQLLVCQSRRESASLDSPTSPGPHAIGPENGVLKDENFGTNGQKFPVFGRHGFFSANGSSPLCGITTTSNVLGKLQADWGVESPRSDQIEDQLFLMDKFMPMFGLDVHRDVIDHGMSITNVERLVQAYARDQMGLETSSEWIIKGGKMSLRQAEAIPARIRAVMDAGMGVALTTPGHILAFAGYAPDDRFLIADPNYPRPLWGSQMSVSYKDGHAHISLPSSPRSRYRPRSLFAIGVKGQATSKSEKLSWSEAGNTVRIEVFEDGWSRLYAESDGKKVADRRGWLPTEVYETINEERTGDQLRTSALCAEVNEWLSRRSTPFRHLDLELAGRKVSLDSKGRLSCTRDGEMETYQLPQISLETICEGVRVARLSPTQGSNIDRVPIRLSGEGESPFTLVVTPPKSPVHRGNVGFYGGTVSGDIEQLGAYSERLEPLLDAVRKAIDYVENTHLE